jgi:hypothetical protein
MKIHAGEQGKETPTSTEMNVDADAGSGLGTATETRTTGDVQVDGPTEQPEITTVEQSGDKQEKATDETESGSAPTTTAAAAAAQAVEDVVESPAVENTGTTGAGGDTTESSAASAIPKDSDTITALDPATVSKAVTMDIDPVPTTSPDQDPVSAPVPPVGTHSAQDPVSNSTATATATATAGETALALDQPWDRFQILLEIAEELSRFKVGVEDKVKVAGSACDHVSQVIPLTPL